MTNQEAITILRLFKRSIRHRNVYEAIELAMQSLALTTNTTITEIKEDNTNVEPASN